MARRFRPEIRQRLRAKVQGLITSGYWTGISFVGASLVGLTLLVEARTGPIIAGLVGLAIYGFSAYVLPNRVRSGQADGRIDTAPTSASPDPRVELLVEAHQHLAILTKTHPKLPASLKAVVKKLGEDGSAITQAATANPDMLTPVLRFFTYYLPATADLVQDRLKLAPHAGAERLAEIDQTLLRLGEAFAGFRAATLEPDLASVDLDITLLDDALDADLEDLKTK
jgi:hypothetical protein